MSEVYKIPSEDGGMFATSVAPGQPIQADAAIPPLIGNQLVGSLKALLYGGQSWYVL